jgi:transposase
MNRRVVRRKLFIRLRKGDLEHIDTLLSAGVQSVRVVKRAQSLRLLATGRPSPQVGCSVGLTAKTVRNIGWRYAQAGLRRALCDRPRPGASPLLTDAQKQQIVAMVCSDPPAGRARWTVRLIAEESIRRKLVPKVGRETIRILLQSHDTKPWRIKSWCVAELTPEYIHKMENVLAIYERPRNEKQPVVCLDEKPVQVHADVRAPLPARKPGQIARQDNEYERRGTANIFCGVEPKGGRHFTSVTPTRSGAEFAGMMKQLADAYPEAETIHLVMDNLSTHTERSLVRRYGAEIGQQLWKRFTVHYTPVHGSWLNQAEIEISVMARQCPGKRRMGSVEKLRSEVRAWNRRSNRARSGINWTFDRRAARRKFNYEVSFKRSRT